MWALLLLDDRRTRASWPVQHGLPVSSDAGVSGEVQLLEPVCEGEGVMEPLASE